MTVKNLGVWLSRKLFMNQDLLLLLYYYYNLVITFHLLTRVYFLCADCSIYVLMRADDMSIFPRISLKPEVTEHLKSVFLNKEVTLLPPASCPALSRIKSMNWTLRSVDLNFIPFSPFFVTFRCWLQWVNRKQKVVSIGCSHVSHIHPHTHVSGPALTSPPWRRSDTS